MLGYWIAGKEYEKKLIEYVEDIQLQFGKMQKSRDLYKDLSNDLEGKLMMQPQFRPEIIGQGIIEPSEAFWLAEQDIHINDHRIAGESC